MRVATVTVDNLNMRTEPNATSQIKGTLKRGDRVTIFESKNGWAKSYGYWVSETYLKYDDESNKPIDKPVVSKKAEYMVKNGWNIIKCKPLDLKLLISDNQTFSNAKFKTGINATYFWYANSSKTKTYPTSILSCEGKCYQDNANHLPSPQSVLIIDKNGNVDMRRVKKIQDIPNWKECYMIVGGLGIKGNGYGYSLSAEGFVGAYSDVARRCNKTMIGYKDGYIYLMAKQNVTQSEANNIASVLGLQYLLSMDGGGSTSMRYEGSTKVNSDGRRINNFIFAGE